MFELFGCNEWQVPDRIALVFADGSEVVMAIDASRTTANGRFAADTAVRLVLHAQTGRADAPVCLRLGLGQQTIDVPIA